MADGTRLLADPSGQQRLPCLNLEMETDIIIIIIVIVIIIIVVIIIITTVVHRALYH